MLATCAGDLVRFYPSWNLLFATLRFQTACVQTTRVQTTHVQTIRGAKSLFLDFWFVVVVSFIFFWSCSFSESQKLMVCSELRHSGFFNTLCTATVETTLPFTQDEHFFLIKTRNLTFDDASPWEKSWVCNDPSQPVWWQNDDARVQGLGSLLCDSRTLIDCPLWVWTLPPLPRYAEKASWGFEDPYPYWESVMKPLLIILSSPFWNSLSLHCNLRSKLFGVVETCDKHMPLKVRMPST